MVKTYHFGLVTIAPKLILQSLCQFLVVFIIIVPSILGRIWRGVSETEYLMNPLHVRQTTLWQDTTLKDNLETLRTNNNQSFNVFYTKIYKFTYNTSFINVIINTQLYSSLYLSLQKYQHFITERWTPLKNRQF